MAKRLEDLTSEEWDAYRRSAGKPEELATQQQALQELANLGPSSPSQGPLQGVTEVPSDPNLEHLAELHTRLRDKGALDRVMEPRGEPKQAGVVGDLAEGYKGGFRQLFKAPKELVNSLIHNESAGKIAAISKKGARGLMQLMPKWHLDPGETPDMLDNPGLNMKKGTKYLNQMTNQFGGDVDKGLAAYNMGPGKLQKILDQADRQGVPWFNLLDPSIKAYIVRIRRGAKGAPGQKIPDYSGMYGGK